MANPALKSIIKPGDLVAVGTVSLIAAAFSATIANIGAKANVVAKHLSEQGISTGAETVMSFIIVALGLFSAAVVTSNIMNTVVSCNGRAIALLRLLGYQSSQLRTKLSLKAVVASLIATVIGVAAGTVISNLLEEPMFGQYDIALPQFSVECVVVGVLIVAITFISAYRGTRRVTKITPLQALSQTHLLQRERATLLPAGIIGGLLLLAAVVLAWFALDIAFNEEATAESSTRALLLGFSSGMLALIGLLVGASVVIPGVIRGVLKLLGNKPAVRIARRNAVSDPKRTGRAATGLIIGITLITMFATAGATVRRSFEIESKDLEPEVRELMLQVADMIINITIGLVAISAVLAIVGIINNAIVTAASRKREFGLLRSLGFTKAQISRMMIIESVGLSLIATTFIGAFGVAYGLIAAKVSLFHYMHEPVIPWPPLGGLFGGAVLVTVAAAAVPIYQINRLDPVKALAQN